MGFLHRAICVHSRSPGVHEDERINTKEQQERNKTRVKTVVFWPGQNVYGLQLSETINKASPPKTLKIITKYLLREDMVSFS